MAPLRLAIRSYSTARTGGAQDWGNALEFTGRPLVGGVPVPSFGETMDLYNNAMGRNAVRHPAYQGLSPADAADSALENGCLQEQP